MFDRSFASEAEINKVYRDHLESLIASRLPFDEAGLRAEWEEAINNFREGLDKPPWLQ